MTAETTPAALLANTPVLPLAQADDPAAAVATARALAAGGLQVIEIVLRTERALACLQAVAESLPRIVPGAGTVLNAQQAAAALRHGARFLVSPGLDEGVISVAQEHQTPIYPGVMTPTEAQWAVNLGLNTVKFFPASLAGGVSALRTLSGVFPSLRFMPTGGINMQNLADFLALPQVFACGGSWLTPAAAVKAGDFKAVTALAEEAARIAQQARGGHKPAQRR